MQKSKGLIAAAIFFAVLAFPLLYNASTIGLFNSAAAAPNPVIAKPGQCVAETGWMRHNHMKMLIHEREEAVREGNRDHKKSIAGCPECHTSREEFCDRCHGFVGVQPECWNCHIYRPRTAQASHDH